jgi:hypothetical protein
VFYHLSIGASREAAFWEAQRGINGYEAWFVVFYAFYYLFVGVGKFCLYVFRFRLAIPLGFLFNPAKSNPIIQ